MLKRLLLALALMGGLHGPAVLAESVAERSLRQVTLAVENMGCSLCKYTVENALRQVEGVRSAEVDMAKAVAVVTYDPAEVQVDALVKAVGDAGYPAAVKE